MEKWIFFDLGSTLLDESLPMQAREADGGPWRHDLDRVYSGTKPLLEQLRVRYRLGIIANQGPGAEQRLRGWGLAQYFDVIVSSAEAGFSKPDPRIFTIALERANCLPQNATMVGDRLDNDIAPAKRLGMKTIWVRQGWGGKAVPTSEEMVADWVVDGLEEVGMLF